MTEVLSLNQLAKKIGAPYTSLLALVRSGELRPDSISGRYFLFKASRLGEIQLFLASRRVVRSCGAFERVF
jgi:hypothetical protein